MRYLTVEEVLALHAHIIEQGGGIHGVRDRAGLEPAVAQPQGTFGGGVDLNPDPEEDGKYDQDPACHT